MKPELYPNWRENVVYAPDHPQPLVLLETHKLRVVLVGMEAGQKLPPHPAPAGVYHFLEGKGWMHVDGQRCEVSAGAIMVVPDGAARGVEAETRLAFIGLREA